MLDATCEQVREACQSVQAFSFDLVEEDPYQQAEGETLRPLASVEPGTPQTIVDAWNSTKKVKLFMLLKNQYCEAAIGNQTRTASLDYKVCVLPREGEDACAFATHADRRATRLPPFEGSFCLSIPSSLGGNQVFSRPMLSESDFVHMPPGSRGFKSLLAIQLEPRVWKVLFEHFPGAVCLIDPKAPPLKTSYGTSKPSVLVVPTSNSMNPQSRCQIALSHPQL